MWLEFELSLQQLQRNTILFVAPPRCVCCEAPCNCHQKTMTKFTSRTSTKKLYFQKNTKKKRNNDNEKQTNKPTTNRNVQQFILNRRRRCRRWIESKNHNKRTRLCEEARATLFLFFYGRSKRRKYCEIHGKMATAHTAYEFRAL